MDDDFRPALIGPDLSLDFHLAPLEHSKIAELGTVRSKDDATKWTHSIIGTKIEKGIAAIGREYAKNPAGDASRFADVRPCIKNIHAPALSGFERLNCRASRHEGVSEGKAVGQECA